MSSSSSGSGALWIHKVYGTGIPCTRYASHTVYLVHGNSKGEVRGRSRHKNNS